MTTTTESYFDTTSDNPILDNYKRVPRQVISYGREKNREPLETTEPPFYGTPEPPVSPYWTVPIEGQFIDRTSHDEAIGGKLQCNEITCVVADNHEATVCFQTADAKTVEEYEKTRTPDPIMGKPE